MRKDLLNRLIAEVITPVANYDLKGNQLAITIVKPDTNDEEAEKVQRGARFVLNTESPMLVRNLENYHLRIPDDLRSEMVKYINKEVATFAQETALVSTNKLVDAKGNPFDPEKHITDMNGNPVMTKFKTFKLKAKEAAG